MKRFVFMPHVHGWGHRIRCDAIARQILALTDQAKTTILVRPDDPIPPKSWTTLPVAHSTFGRTWAILRASVLVEDGLVFADARVRLMKLLGGKLALVVQPTGFSADPEIDNVLDLADVILVPFPPALLPPSARLLRQSDKVQLIPPVLATDSVPRQPPVDRLVTYVMVSRPSPNFRETLKAAKELLEKSRSKKVEILGSPGNLASEDQHLRSLSQAHVVVAQGTTSALETLRLGIPLVFVPSAEASEQIELARTLRELGLAGVLMPDECDSGCLARELEAAVSRSDTPRPSVPGLEGSGSEMAGRILCKLTSLPMSAVDAPPLSVISTNYNCGHALRRHLESIYRQFDEEGFEYMLFDNFSEDDSPAILEDWRAAHGNFTWEQSRCTMGRGRELAARRTAGEFILVVDTDTAYYPTLRTFVNRAIAHFPQYAVQGIYAGVFPRYLWRTVGGRGNYNVGEDFEMWMRLWSIGRMKWCPTRLGENIKEPQARDSSDHLSGRYRKSTRLLRLARREFDALQLSHYEKLDLESIWRQNVADLGVGPLESSWFGERKSGTILERAESFVRDFLRILTADSTSRTRNPRPPL